MKVRVKQHSPAAAITLHQHWQYRHTRSLRTEGRGSKAAVLVPKACFQRQTHTKGSHQTILQKAVKTVCLESFHIKLRSLVTGKTKCVLQWQNQTDLVLLITIQQENKHFKRTDNLLHVPDFLKKFKYYKSENFSPTSNPGPPPPSPSLKVGPAIRFLWAIVYSYLSTYMYATYTEIKLLSIAPGT